MNKLLTRVVVRSCFSSHHITQVDQPITDINSFRGNYWKSKIYYLTLAWAQSKMFILATKHLWAPPGAFSCNRGYFTASAAGGAMSNRMHTWANWQIFLHLGAVNWCFIWWSLFYFSLFNCKFESIQKDKVLLNLILIKFWLNHECGCSGFLPSFSYRSTVIYKELCQNNYIFEISDLDMSKLILNINRTNIKRMNMLENMTQIHDPDAPI